MDLDQRQDANQWVSKRKRAREKTINYKTPSPSKKKNTNCTSVPEMIVKGEEEIHPETSLNKDYMEQVECDSQEDLFGDYDSFADDSSFLAQFEDVGRSLTESGKEDRKDAAVEFLMTFQDPNLLNYLQNDKDKVHNHPAKNVTLSTGEAMKVCSGQKSNTASEQICTEGFSVMHPRSPDETDELPGSQLALAEEFNSLLKKSKTKGFKSEASQVLNSCDSDPPDVPSVLENETLNLNLVQNQSRTTNSGTSKQMSLKDQMKNAMAGNAMVSIPKASKSKQLKEIALSEEINVAMKTIEATSGADMGPFYGLPSKVKELIFQFKGIKELY
eukprot:g37020.t1